MCALDYQLEALIASSRNGNYDNEGPLDGTPKIISNNVLQNRAFLLLWIAQAISQTAQNTLNFALIVAVEQISHSSIHVSLVVLAFIIPAVIFGPIAGVFVDRVDKRWILLTTNVLRAGTVIAYWALVPSQPTIAALLAIYVLSVIFATISQFFAPAEAATIPLLVDPQRLVAANSFFSLTLIAAQLAGFAFVGPLLVKVTTLGTLFIVVAVLYSCCSVLVALLPSFGHQRQSRRPASVQAEVALVWREVYDLWRFMTRERNVTTSMLDLAATTTIFLMLGTLGVGIVTRIIGLAPSDLAYVMASGGIGVIAGLLLLGRLTSKVSERRLVDGGLAAMGAAILAMAGLNGVSRIFLAPLPDVLRANTTLAIFMLLGVVLGAASIFVSTTAQTQLQRNTPPALRGRVFAALFTVSSALAVLPVLFTGALADLIGLPAVMALIGVFTIALAVVGHLSRNAAAEQQ